MHLARFCARWLWIALALACGAARADTPIVLFKSFAGNLNFVGTQKTMRTAGNGSNACAVSTGTLTASLAGIPAAATVLSAHLYWAGSSSTPDYTVTFDGTSVTAPANRQFTSATVGYNYFSGAADVTPQVVAKRNANYTFTGLSVTNGAPYCAVEGVVGGFSLLVIYSVPTETFRVLNLYEGFQYIRTFGTDDISVNLNLTNFKIPSPLNNATGRIAHVTWEGDSSLLGGGEKLLFNNYEMTDSANTAGNQFNSNSNIGGSADNTSYGIDFDAFVLSSPRIAAGQTTATMSYESGQDMVLLNAEIVAVPNVPVSDLSLGMTFGGTPSRGSSVTFTHTVSNQGPLAAPASNNPGTVTVKHILATGLTFASVSGTGWTCVTGQTVTCTSTAAIANGASLPPLVITAQIALNAPASMTTSATVSGAMFDNNSANNSASHTITFSTSRYVFTDVECTSGVAFGAGQPCKIVSLPSQIAAQNANLYITALDLVNRPAAPSASSVTLYLALICHNPVANAGKQATVLIGATTTTLNLCVANGANPTAAQWRSLSVPFATGKASTAVTFNYPDVGQVELLLSDSTNSVLTSTTGRFVVRPYKFVLSTGLVANPANVTSLKANIAPFVKAGSEFMLIVTVLNYKQELTPNFGKEIDPETVELAATAAADSDDNGETFSEMDVDPGTPFTPLQGAFGAFSGGVANGAKFIWDNVGIITVVPSVSDYLNSGKVIGTSLNLGRFYPDHFDTFVPVILVCAPPHPLACSGTGMHYSRQPIGTLVAAYGATGNVLTFYHGRFARHTVLSAVPSKGGVAAPVPGALSGATVAAASYVKGVASAAPAFTLTPPATAPAAPATIYLRAFAANAVAGEKDSTSSDRAAQSVEGGTKVVQGRLLIDNAYGSELLSLPISMRAQYWDGARWTDSTKDSISIAAGATLVHSVDSAKLSLVGTGCGAVACSSNGTKPAALTTASLVNGVFKFRLPAPAAVTDRRFTLSIADGPAWLPPVPARITFGIHKTTPVIYIREIF